MIPSRLVLFDIDGTLLHAGGTGRRAFSRAFQEVFGIEEAYRSVVAHGRTDLCLINEIAQLSLGRSLDQSETLQLKELYIRYFQVEVVEATRFRTLPGARQIVQELSLLSMFSLGIETGNFRETAQAKLERAELKGFFISGGFGCDSNDRSEIVRVAIERAQKTASTQFEKIIVIGDAIQDVRAAKANGCGSVLVLTGGGPDETQDCREADLIVADLNDSRYIIEFLRAY